MNEQTYKFNLYRAAKFVRSVRAYSVPDAVAMIPEFTDAKIHSPWTSAHQWIGLEALELIIEIEATKPVETKCPATYDVTGWHMQRASIINRCHTMTKITFTPTQQADSTRRISDGTESVWVCWPAGVTEDQMIEAYAAGYDGSAEIDVYDAETNEHLMCWGI